MTNVATELELYFHPFASYCQKVLVALYERDIPFRPRASSTSAIPTSGRR